MSQSSAWWRLASSASWSEGQKQRLWYKYSQAFKNSAVPKQGPQARLCTEISRPHLQLGCVDLIPITAEEASLSLCFVSHWQGADHGSWLWTDQEAGVWEDLGAPRLRFAWISMRAPSVCIPQLSWDEGTARLSRKSYSLGQEGLVQQGELDNSIAFKSLSFELTLKSFILFPSLNR